MKIISITISLLFFFVNISQAQCVQGDCQNGTGTMLYTEGKYQGEFKNGKRNGNGTYVWSNGAKYRGTWSDNKMNGTGTYIFANGNVYRGNFSNGLKDGEGVLSKSKEDGGAIIKKGKWKDDMYLETSRMYKYVNFGYAAVNTILPDFDFQSAGSCTYLNPVGISYDQGITNNINVGAFASYAFHNYNSAMSINSEVQDVDVDYSYILVGGNVIYNIHIGNMTSVTPYVGLSAGYNLRSATYSTGGVETEEASILSQIDDNAGIFSDFEPELIWGAYGGVRVFPLDNIGLFAEGGIGFTNLRAGVTLRL